LKDGFSTGQIEKDKEYEAHSTGYWEAIIQGVFVDNEDGDWTVLSSYIPAVSAAPGDNSTLTIAVPETSSGAHPAADDDPSVTEDTNKGFSDGVPITNATVTGTLVEAET
jgi:hypothetical protein